MEYSRGELYLNGVNIRVKRVQSLVGRNRMWKFRSARRTRNFGKTLAWLGWIDLTINFFLSFGHRLGEFALSETILGILMIACPLLIILGYTLRAIGSRRMKFVRDDFNAEHLIGL